VAWLATTVFNGETGNPIVFICLVQTCQYKSSYELVDHPSTMIGLLDALIDHHLYRKEGQAEDTTSSVSLTNRKSERSLSIPQNPGRRAHVDPCSPLEQTNVTQISLFGKWR
jgi:hypothetical protein